MLAIFKREFKSYFQNVTGWLFVAAVIALFGLYFFVINMLNGYATITNDLSSNAFIMMLAVPILTMRSLAEDRHSKADQLTLTAPVSLFKVIMGKYLAMVAIFTIDIAAICLAPLFLKIFGTVSMVECYVGILGYWLYGCTCIAIGMFFSSITESQVIAAVTAIAALFLGYMMSSICSILPSGTGFFGKLGSGITTVLSCYDLYSPLNNFMNSTLDVTGIVYYVSVSALFIFLSTQVIQKRRWSVSKEKIGTGVYSVGMILGSIAVVVVLNIGVGQIPYRFTSIDVTSNHLYSITKETKEYISTLDEDVTLYCLGTEDSSNEYAKNFIETLKRYEGLSDHIDVEFVDPTVNANFYTNYTDTAPSQYSVIAVSAERSKVVDFNDVFEYSYDMDYSTYQYTTTVTAYDGEGQLTSAIEYVTMSAENLPTVYETTGHGETAVSGDFSDVITKANMTLEDITLLENDAVPDDCSLLIINGATTDFSSDDAQKVIDYIDNGGQVMINLDCTSGRLTNLYSIIEAYGMSIDDGMVCETSQSNYYSYPHYLLPNIESSDYTADASSYYIFYPYSSAIVLGEDTDDFTYTTIMDTTESAVLKKDFSNIQTMDDFNADTEAGDEEGQFVVAAAVETSAGAHLVVNGSYMVFTDDADSVVSMNNSTYFEDTLGTLVEQGDLDLVVVDSKSYDNASLTVTTAAAVRTLLFFVLLTIGLVVGGIIVWAKRRKR